MKLSMTIPKYCKAFTFIVAVTLLCVTAIQAQQPKPASNVDPLGILNAPSTKETPAAKEKEEPKAPAKAVESKSPSAAKPATTQTPKSVTHSASLDTVMVGVGAPASWVRGGAAIPSNAVEAGNENGSPLYACRASHKGGLHPGKVVGEGCNFGYGGKEEVSKKFEVLVGGGTWERANNSLGEPYAAGKESGSSLYLCRGTYQGGVHPGKVVAGNCNIGYGRKEISLTEYEVFYSTSK